MIRRRLRAAWDANRPPGHGAVQDHPFAGRFAKQDDVIAATGQPADMLNVN